MKLSTSTLACGFYLVVLATLLLMLWSLTLDWMWRWRPVRITPISGQDISNGGLKLQHQAEKMSEKHGLKLQDQKMLSEEQDGLKMQGQVENMSEEQDGLKMQYQMNEEQGEMRKSQDQRRKLEVPNQLTLSDSNTHEVSLVSGLKWCQVPEGGFKAWKKGVVTVLSPELPVDCSKVAAGDVEEMARINRTVPTWRNAMSDQGMLVKVQNCSWLRDHFHQNLYNSQLEDSFPIAFTFVVYDSPQQVLRLLRLLYRPQNTYCIHFDVKSRHKEFFRAIAECFDNVMVSSHLENVVWGYYTIMQAQMNCLVDLIEHRRARQQHKWRYVINLCGKELPVATTREMVTRLMKLGGASSIITQSCAKRKVIIQRRLVHPVELSGDGTGIVVRMDRTLEGRPFSLTQYHKSSSYNALSYQFAHYLTFNSTARSVYKFFKKTSNAEEHYYATMYHFPEVPGGFDKTLHRSSYFEVSGSYWTKANTFQHAKVHGCHGKALHNVCVLVAGDVPRVVKDRNQHLFFNKYFMEYDHTVMGCMEQSIVARNKMEYQQECHNSM